MGVACSERFSDPDYFGALNPELILKKICEAEQRDVARSGKVDSKAQVEITFNHTQVTDMANDQKHHKEKMVRQLTLLRSRSRMDRGEAPADQREV